MIFIAGLVVMPVGFLSAKTPMDQSPVPSPTSVVYSFDTGGRVSLKGTATLSSWSCLSKSPDGFTKIPLSQSRLTSIQETLKTSIARAKKRMSKSLHERPRGLLWIPVRSFRCDNQKMTRDMHQALKGNQYKIILFRYHRLKNVEILQLPSGDTPFKINLTLTGGLALAGQAKTVTLEVHVTQQTPETFKLTGTFDIRMSEFDIEPPTALMGLIQAHDNVTVQFSIQARKITHTENIEPFVRKSLADYAQLLKSTAGGTTPASSP